MNISNLIPFGKKHVSVRREEEHPFVTMQREMNRIFDAFNRNLGFDGFPEPYASFSPRMEVFEDAKALTVTAELPGMSEKDIDVSLAGDTLTIRGEKKEETEDESGSCYYSERSYGAFNRAIPLPRQVDAEKISAHFKKGVLTITLPKTAEAANETRKVPVTTA